MRKSTDFECTFKINSVNLLEKQEKLGKCINPVLSNRESEKFFESIIPKCKTLGMFYMK